MATQGWTQSAAMSGRRQGGEQPGLPPSLTQLTTDLYALKLKVQSFPTTKELEDERHRRIAVETELEAARQHIDDNDARLARLEEDVRSWHHEIVQEVSREMLDFQGRVVQPLEEQVRAMHDVFPEIEHQAEAANQIATASQQAHGLLQTQIQGITDDTQRTVLQLREQLGAGQSDHAEALVNLMEMVEQTATHDQLTTALEGVAADLDAQTTQLVEQITAANDRVEVVEQELGRSVQDLAGVVDEQVEALEARFQEMIQATASEMREQITQLGSDGRAMSSETQSKIDDLASDVELRTNELTRRCVEFEETMGSMSSAKARDEIVLKLTQQVQSLDAKMENTAQVLHQKVELTAEEMDRQLDQTVLSVDSKLAKGARDAAIKAEMASKSLQEDFAEEKNTLDTEVAKLKSTIERQEKRLLSTLSEDAKIHLTRLKAEVGGLKSTFDERIGQVVAQVERKMEDAQQRVDASTIKVDDMGQRVSETAQENVNRTAEAMDRLDDMRKQLEEQVQQVETNAASTLKLEVTRLEADIGAERQVSQSAIQRVERKCMTDTDAVKRSQEQRFDKVKDAVATLDRKLDVRCSNIETALADQHAQFSAQFTAVEGRTSDKNMSLQVSLKELAEQVNANQRAATAGQTSAEQKVEQRFRHHQSQLDSRCTALADVNARLEVRLSEYKDKVDSTVNDRHAQLEEQILKTRTDMNDRHAQLDQRHSDSQSDFEDRLLQNQASQEARLEQALAKLRATEIQCTRTEAELESVSTNAKDMREQFSRRHGDLENTLEAQRLDTTTVMDDVKARLAQNTAHFTNLIGGLEAKSSGIESNIAGTMQSIEDTRDKFSGVCSRLESEMREDRKLNHESVTDLAARIATINTDTESTIHLLRQQMLEKHLGLESKLVKEKSSAEELAKTQYQNIVDIVKQVELQCEQIDASAVSSREELDSKLESKATELNDKFMSLNTTGSDRAKRAEDIMDALATETEKNKRSLEDMCSKVEKKNVAAMQLLEDQIADQSDSLIQLVGKVERTVDKMEARQVERTNELQVTFEDAQTAAAAAVTELRVRLSTKLDELEENVQKDHDHFVAECERIDQKSSDESKSVDKKLVSTTSMLMTNLQKLSKDLAAHVETSSETHDSLDAKYEMQCEDIRARLKTQLEVLSRELMEQMQELMKKDELLDAAIHQQHLHFTTVSADLRDCHDTATSELEDWAKRTDEDVAAVDKNFRTACEELVEQITTINTTLTQKLQNAQAHLDAKDAEIEASLYAKVEELMDKDAALSSSLQAETDQRHLEIDKLEKANAKLMLDLEDKSVKMDAAVAAVDSAADARDAAQTVRVNKLDADITTKIMTSIEELEGSVNRDLKPLLKTVDEIGIKLVTVAEQASTADTTATRLNLLQMDVKQIGDNTQTLIERSDRDFDELSSRLDATTTEVQDLALDFTGLELAAMLDPANSTS